MYALVTVHRGVIMSVVTGPSTGDLKRHLMKSLGHMSGPLPWTNYISHWGVATSDGLTVHTIHQTKEAS